MSEENLQQKLAEAQETIDTLRQELTETNREVMALTLDLDRRMDHLRALNALGSIINQARGVEELLQRAIDESLRLVGVEAAGILLINREAGLLRQIAHRGISQTFAEEVQRWRLGEGMAGTVAQTGEPVVIDHLEEYPGAFQAFLEREHIQSIASIPLIGSQGVLGVMNLATSHHGHFDDQAVDLLLAIGRQIAVGVERARLHEETQTWAEELEHRVRKRTAELEAVNRQLEQEIAERRRAEEELRRHQEHLEEIVEERTQELRESRRRIAEALELNHKIIGASSVGITAYEASGDCVLANASAAQIIGATREQILDQNFRSIQSWQDAGLLQGAETALDEDRQVREEVRVVSTFGRDIWIDCRFVPFILRGQPHLLLVIDDVTEQKRLQEKLIRQEKLATLGRLAGSVSHELRNPLGAIKNAAYFLTMAVDAPDPDVQEALEILEREVDRSEGVIQGLLDFARSEPPTRREVDLNHVVEAMLERLAVPPEVEVSLRLDRQILLLSHRRGGGDDAGPYRKA